MVTGLLALGTVESKVVGFSGYAVRAPLVHSIIPRKVTTTNKISSHQLLMAGLRLLAASHCHWEHPLDFSSGASPSLLGLSYGFWPMASFEVDSLLVLSSTALAALLSGTSAVNVLFESEGVA